MTLVEASTITEIGVRPESAGANRLREISRAHSAKFFHNKGYVEGSATVIRYFDDIFAKEKIPFPKIKQRRFNRFVRRRYMSPPLIPTQRKDLLRVNIPAAFQQTLQTIETMESDTQLMKRLGAVIPEDGNDFSVMVGAADMFDLLQPKLLNGLL